MAFCCWLSEVTGEKILLPTEQQWQRAAQGDDGRDYPWGKDWDGTRCNNSVSPQKSDRTTLVRQYEERGDSPFGVVDLAGNVLEWCLTAYETGQNDIDGTAVRVLRGGSWYSVLTAFCRVWFRDRLNPQFGSYSYGFRCVRSY
jgi:formylglycine-generating enzyme required for sulfatase activity